MVSDCVTKTSKKRQVRRAVDRNESISGSDSAERFPPDGRLAQNAMAGEAIHTSAKGAASIQVPPAAAVQASATTARTGAPAMRR